MEPAYSNLDVIITDLSVKAVLISAIILIILSVISIKLKNAGLGIKKLLFLSFVAITISCTLFLAGSTIYLNTVSISGGPVHHHADYEIWRCGEEVELKDPQGLSNKIGTPTLHEHNDKRIHLEGVIVKPLDASLDNFFRVVGGSFENDRLTFPGNSEEIVLESGDDCLDVENTQLQVFLYKVEGDFFAQTKLENPRDHIITADQNVPPGDCIIIELDAPKQKTEYLCRSFKVAVDTGDLKEFKN